MNLTKMLAKEAQKQRKEILGDDILEHTKQFLLEAHQEDEKVLHQLGLDHDHQYTKQLTADIYRSKKANELYKTTSFTGEQIKQLCIAYDLKMLHTYCYNGKLPVDLVRKLKEFESNNEDVDLNDSDNFFILAPVEQFNTHKHVPRKQDPILFYRDAFSSNRRGRAKETDSFIQVHNWGNDFTFLRGYKDLLNTYKSSNDSTASIILTLAATIGWFVINSLYIFLWGPTAFTIYGVLFFNTIIALMYVSANKPSKYHELWNRKDV